MVGCVLSLLKPSELYILSCGKAEAFSTAKNVELRGFYPIHLWGFLDYTHRINPEELYILSCGKGVDAFSTAKNVELRWFYPIHLWGFYTHRIKPQSPTFLAVEKAEAKNVELRGLYISED